MRALHRQRRKRLRKFNDSGTTLCNDVIVGHDDAVLAYEEAAALGYRCHPYPT